MACSKGYEREYDFVEQPPEEFFCPVSFAVLLEPYQTQCCANQLSQEAYQRLQGQPCPVCREENLAAVKDNYHKRRVLSLKVRCPHKAEGCEWEGELRSLEQHLNTNSSAGECRYVDVDCPYACGERVQRRSLEEHKSQRCPLRPFTCQYCNHKATHQKVTKEHWPVCEKYPLPCPNECGEEEIERQHLKGHLEQTCPLEVIHCDFSYAGCGAQLQRRLMSAHMKEGMEAHLSLLSLVVPTLQTIVQQQGDQIKQQGDMMNQMRDQIKQDRDQMKHMENRIKQLEKPFPPLDIIMDDFKKHKKKADIWYSPPFYTHLGGYMMCLKVYPNGIGFGEGTHVSVFVCLMRGEFDDLLKWPFRGGVAIQLKIPPHQQLIINLDDSTPNASVCKPINEMNLGQGFQKYMSHADLYAGGYLKDDKLVFCVSDIEVKSK